ncbi:MAG: hypothetical protein J6L69_02970 [Lachnospiraceae bacterium]|nr:hypothetical protein [Lachnospiraceae bacterium]
MSGRTKKRTLVCDFETTVYKGQENTEVWASAVVELFTEDVKIFHSIGETFEYFVNLDCDLICYYHNLKFDGSFWLDYLLTKLKYTEAFYKLNEEGTKGKWLKTNHMTNNTFKYMISEMGQWYSITIKVNGHTIEIRDSLKLLPFKVSEIGKDFKTKHRKLDMEYVGYRYAGCEITEEEKKYIANDVLVVKEALEILALEGHDKITIGSCCLEEFKKTYSEDEYQMLFPNLMNVDINEKLFGSPNAEKYIRRSYKGGWCYLVKGKERKVKKKGTTADVNSLYPSMMSSESGNEFPYGLPTFWKGDFIPNEALQEHRYYFVRIKTRFYIKKDKLPFIQIKNSYMYKGTEALTTSDYKDPRDDKYYTHYTDIHGIRHDTRLTLTLTMTDYQLLKDHYNLVDFEILDGCWFKSVSGLFDEYMEKYKKQKMSSVGAPRQLAKLFLNNLYGKFASSDDSSFKKAFIREDGAIGFIAIEAHEKEVGYIPIGSAITSYARNFTIRAAQKNYHGVDERGFIYADTDSIHCDLEPEEIKGITVHPTNFCCWALESCWDEGIFVRQKTYIEHVTHKDLEPVEKPYYDVKCAGMPKKSKDLFVASMIGLTDEQEEKWNDEEKKWCETKRTLNDFDIGLEIPFGKLRPKRIKGGCLLVETKYKMR